MLQQERKNMVELVREIIPGVSDEEAGWILWNRTCFPCGTTEEVRQDLERVRLEMAAPDLLEACETALLALTDSENASITFGAYCGVAVAQEKLRAAIAKAKGEG